MTFYVTNQNYVVLWLLLVGVIIGVIYDIFKIKHEVFGAKLIIYVIDDIVFSLIYIVIFLFAIFLTNYGYVRWYEIVSAFTGFFVYKITLSKFLVKFFVTLIRNILKVLNVILVVLFKPIKQICSFVFSVLLKIRLLIIKNYQISKIKNNSRKKLKREISLSRKGFYKT